MGTSSALGLAATHHGSCEGLTPPSTAKERGANKRGDLGRYSDSINQFRSSDGKKGESAPDQQLSLGDSSSSAESFDEDLLVDGLASQSLH